MDLPLHVSKTSEYCWIQIPKCASSTIRRVLNEHTTKDLHSHNEWEKIEYTEQHAELFTFIFVRNPFDRLVSCYYDKIVCHERWSNIKRQSDSIHYMIDNKFNFHQFIEKITTDFYGTDDHWMNCTNFIPKNHKNNMFIGKCENLQSDFNYVCKKIKIPSFTLPSANKTNHKHYTEYYNNETRKLVEERYADDLINFEYKF